MGVWGGQRGLGHEHRKAATLGGAWAMPVRRAGAGAGSEGASLRPKDGKQGPRGSELRGGSVAGVIGNMGEGHRTHILGPGSSHLVLCSDSHSLSTSPQSLGPRGRTIACSDLARATASAKPGACCSPALSTDPRASHRRANALIFLPLLSLQSKVTFT